MLLLGPFSRSRLLLDIEQFHKIAPYTLHLSLRTTEIWPVHR
jgi:hypothetical protein